jgi:hypothetical protein
MTPANNYFGHGFYQFSPELFFRIFTPANGFVIERLIAAESDLFSSEVLGLPFIGELQGRRFSVRDPAEVRQRVLLSGTTPIILQIQARRTSVVPIFEQYPQQSDYTAAWAGATARPPLPPPPPTDPAVGQRLPARSPIRSAARKFLYGMLGPGAAQQMQFDVLPAVARFMAPFHQARAYRQRSLANRALYKRID